MTLSASPARGVLSASDLPTLYADPDVFPALPGQSFHIDKHPEFNTSVTRAYSGREVSLQAWATPLWNFKISYEVIRDKPALPELGRLWSFFASRAGKFGFFYFYDPFDNAVTNQIIGVGDGVTSSFQLVRTVGAGTVSAYIEPVYALMSGGGVFINGTSQSATTFAVSPWGVISFSSPPAPGATITYTGTFLFVCRFDQDILSMSQMGANLYSNDGLTFVSKRP